MKVVLNFYFRTNLIRKSYSVTLNRWEWSQCWYVFFIRRVVIVSSELKIILDRNLTLTIRLSFFFQNQLCYTRKQFNITPITKIMSLELLRAFENLLWFNFPVRPMPWSGVFMLRHAKITPLRFLVSSAGAIWVSPRDRSTNKPCDITARFKNSH